MMTIDKDFLISLAAEARDGDDNDIVIYAEGWRRISRYILALEDRLEFVEKVVALIDNKQVALEDAMAKARKVLKDET